MTKLGIFLIIAAVVYLLVTIFSPDILVPLAPLFCPSGQKLKSETITYSRPGETDMNNYYHCVDSDNRELSDVTGSVMILVMGGFFVLLGGGVGLTILGASRVARSQGGSMRVGKSYVLPTIDPDGPPLQASSFRFASSHDANAGSANLDDLMEGLQHGVIRFGGQEIHVDELKAGNYQMNVGQGSQRTLSETLRQLEDAHTQGLINDDEYQKLRQEALDKLI
ncbi:MAG: hypothetical protein GC204_17025 [Chloroflexi bacterium]|nr:hypothetical protein [Chloroflexota bacterium]